MKSGPRESAVLILNGGSSSVKFALYDVGGAKPTRVFRGAIAKPATAAGADRLLRRIAAELRAHGLPVPAAVGHRLVHGGPMFFGPARITRAIRRRLEKAVKFAPLHLPAELALVDAAMRIYPGAPQIACFDTAFHTTMPERARRLPLARELAKGGVARYGFHGLSCESIVGTLGTAALNRAVIAHLGGGASLTAVHRGRSIDTTMGFTPAGGIMMGTRSGDLDPGIIVHWWRRGRRFPDELEKLVNHESGLKAVGGSADVRELLRRRREPRSRLAIAMFCDQVRQRIAALSANLGGIDALIFTGGAGEGSAVLRQEICRGLDYLGIRLDPARNRTNARLINARSSSCRVHVVSAAEDAVIARHVQRVLGKGAPGRRLS